MAFKIENKPFLQRLKYFIKVSPKPELFISPSWDITKVDSFIKGLEIYLEQCATQFHSHGELLLDNISALSIICSQLNLLQDFKNTITKIWLEKKVMLKLAIMVGPETDLTLLHKIREKLYELISGICINSELFIQHQTNNNSNNVREYNLNTIKAFSEQTGIKICAVKVNTKNISNVSMQSIKLLSIETLLFDYSACDNLSIQDDVINLMKNFHNCILFSNIENLVENITTFIQNGISFYLSRSSTQVDININDLIFEILTIENRAQNELELVLLNKQRLKYVETFLQVGYNMCHLSLFEKSLFLERLATIRLRVGYTHPPPKRVAIFGKRSTPEDSPLYAEAREIAECLAIKGYIISTGGYIGIMEAASRGAREGQEKINSTTPLSEGVTSHAIFTNRKNCNMYVSKEYLTSDFLERCSGLLRGVQLVVVMPGSEGTLIELLLANIIGIIDSSACPGICKYVVAKRDPWERTLDSLSKNLSISKSYFDKNVRYFDSAAEAVHIIENLFELISSIHDNYL